MRRMVCAVVVAVALAACGGGGGERESSPTTTTVVETPSTTLGADGCQERKREGLPSTPECDAIDAEFDASMDTLDDQLDYLEGELNGCGVPDRELVIDPVTGDGSCP